MGIFGSVLGRNINGKFLFVIKVDKFFREYISVSEIEKGS